MESLFPLDENKEYTAYKTILPDLLEVIDANYAPREHLEYKNLVSSSSVYYGTSLLFRICIRKKASYFSVSKPKYFDKAALYQNKTDQAAGFYRCDLESPEDIARYSQELCRILDAAINSQPKECDICDLYRDCSDAKKCVHWSREFALHCGYRRILKSGRIFYGENRNVD